MFPKKIFIQNKSTINDVRTITIRIKCKKSSYIEHLKPIIVALKLFGVMPITELENGPTFTFSSWIMLYSLSVFICLISLTFYKFYLDYTYYSSPDRYTFNLLTRIAGTSITLITFTIPIFWIDMKNIPEYWKRWRVFQDKYELCMRKPLQLNITKRLWAVTIMPTALMTLNIGISAMFVKVWVMSNAIMFIIIFGIINLSTGYFYINCHIFQNVIKDINHRIMELMVTKGSTTRFKEHAELWCHMSHLITDFGIVHGGMFCSTALVMYIVSTITLYVLFMTLLGADKEMASAVILPSVFANSILVVYSESAYVALSEVGPKLQWKVLNSMVYGLVEQTQREVQDFIEMIQLCRTNINFGGFCYVNRELFISYLLAVFFNLVVVFQSQLIPKQYTSE